MVVILQSWCSVKVSEYVTKIVWANRSVKKPGNETEEKAQSEILWVAGIKYQTWYDNDLLFASAMAVKAGYVQILHNT